MRRNKPLSSERQRFKTHIFDCQTTSSLALCLQGSAPLVRHSCWISQLFFHTRLGFWDVPLEPHVPSSRAKFPSVSHCFQRCVKGLGWGMPSHWKHRTCKLVVVGDEQLEKSWKRAIPKGLLLKKCCMAPESTCLKEREVSLFL